MAASALRLGRGIKACLGPLPKETLGLHSFEASAFSRIVRERLCSELFESARILRHLESTYGPG